MIRPTALPDPVEYLRLPLEPKFVVETRSLVQTKEPGWDYVGSFPHAILVDLSLRKTASGRGATVLQVTMAGMGIPVWCHRNA